MDSVERAFSDLNKAYATDWQLFEDNPTIKQAIIDALWVLSTVHNPFEDTATWHSDIVRAQEAAGFGLDFRSRFILAMTLIEEETKELNQSAVDALTDYETKEDIPLWLKAAVAKEAADVVFVVCQLMHTLGIPFDQVYENVLDSNYSKLFDGAKFREDGKLLKGDSYYPPRLEQVLTGYDHT